MMDRKARWAKVRVLPAATLALVLIAPLWTAGHAEAPSEIIGGGSWKAIVNDHGGARPEQSMAAGRGQRAPEVAARKHAPEQGKSNNSKKPNAKSKPGQAAAGGVTSLTRWQAIETGSVDSATTDPARVITPPSAAAGAPVDTASLAWKFCVNFKPQAEELRIAFQRKELAAIESELDKRMNLLDSRIKELRDWLDRRREFTSKAQDALVKIYTKMRPDAAASQLASIDVETAAAVLLKLDARASSAILNDMDAKLAAVLAATIVSASRAEDALAKPAAAPQ